jgi:AraC-like DNA-binding protein
MLNMGSPAHPLLTIVRDWGTSDFNLKEVKFTSDLYYFALKGNISGAFKYGRNTYDYQEGTLVFMGPGQVATFERTKTKNDEGWAILFHPDLIRKSELGQTIKNYSFFHYDITEALHLSNKEKQFLNAIVENLEEEINQNLDKHSQDLIIQNLETILKYSIRYYDRQFYTRTNINKDIVTRFENYLITYFASPQLSKKGIPSITDCGNALNISGGYLSDLLKLETGKSTKDHIYAHLIELAKNKLLNSTLPVSEIAFNLGFEYPQHFSKLFKNKTGYSPSQYRNLN